MLLLRVIAKLAFCVALAGCLAGCIPDESRVDEEKDPHFQRGRNLVNSQDYKGAVEEFEKALETNPRSAAAHFELGWLYDIKLNDYAAAIYHYERNRQLNPKSDFAQRVEEQIRSCKQELANNVFPLPDSRNLQREVDRLTAENLALKQRIDVLQRQAAASTSLVQPSAEPARLAANALPRAETAAQTTASTHPRVHVIRDRETISSIAAQYGFKAGAILAANPGVEPRRLRVGQSLNLP
jgi:tetratricopeptide (TPR) repeat protein